jgi:catechol 2,3-dioxygenase
MSTDVTATRERTNHGGLPPTLRLGEAHLTVTDLGRSLPFYERSIGLRHHWREGDAAGFGGGGADLLVLHEEPSARPAGRHAGLYHVALLHPSREELARAAMRLVATQTRIRGASDHEISEAIYLFDPDGNELELAADRPREVWPDLSKGFAGGPLPLDMHGLLATVTGEEPRPHVDPALKVGHMHLHVGDIDEGLRFYRDALGFDLMTSMPTAAFVSVNGYHHNLAFNTWRGEGVPPSPPNTVGLRHWTIVLDSPEQVAEVGDRMAAAGYDADQRDEGVLLRDPWSIALLVTAPSTVASSASSHTN